jgi:hypothetical protein
MNSKTAKQLRKIAKSMATEPFSTKTLGNSKKFVLVANPENEGKGPEDVTGKLPLVVYHAGSVMVNPNSEKGVYKQLKKAARQQRA